MEILRKALQHFSDFVPVLESGDGEDTEKCGIALRDMMILVSRELLRPHVPS